MISNLDGLRALQQMMLEQQRYLDLYVDSVWLALAGTEPDHPLFVAPDAPHWHVQRHDEDDDILAADTVFAALQYASGQLDRIAEFTSEGIAAHGEQGAYQDAYAALRTAAALGVLSDIAANLWRQASVPPWQRAPLYQCEAPRAVGLLRTAAAHAVERINNEGPAGFALWQCALAECAPTDEDEQEAPRP